MKRILARPGFAVFDDVLSPRQFDRVSRFVSHAARLRPIHAESYLRTWSYDDGQPLMSAGIALEPARKGSGFTARYPPAPGAPFPSGTPTDFVLRMLLRHLGSLKRWTGTPNRDWRSLVARAFIYPPGSGLNWHTDDQIYAGAFTFYTHACWKPHWAGELLIEERGPRAGTGTYLAPTPNRLVVIKAGEPHKIVKVSALAGENLRCAISGFFMKDALPR